MDYPFYVSSYKKGIIEDHAALYTPRGELTDDQFNKLERVMHSYRTSDINSAYADLKQARDWLVGMPEALELLEYGERNYAIALMQAMQPQVTPTQIQARRDLPVMREQLAQIYADGMAGVLRQQGRAIPPGYEEKQIAGFKARLEGTFTTYLLNMLQESGLVPQEMKHSSLSGPAR